MQILDQATYQLGLPTAARRIYTQDGTLILSIGDLIKWTITTYGMENLTLGQDQKQGQNSHVFLYTNVLKIEQNNYSSACPKTYFGVEVCAVH